MTETPMRILMVTTSYPLFPGDGTAPFIESIATGVAARGHEVDVLLPEHPRLRPRELERGRVRLAPFAYAPTPAFAVWGYAQSLRADVGFKWRTLAVAPFAALATRRAVTRRLRETPYDVVHAHWAIPSGALVAGPSGSRPFVVSLHGSDVFVAERSAAIGAAARRAFRAAGAVTACSSDLARRAIALGAPADRVAVIPYGVDTSWFAPRPADAAMRERLGAKEGDVLVVAVGRLVEKKGFGHLVEAATSLRGVRVAIVGDGDLARELSERVRASGAPVTLAGRFSREETRDALAAADVVAVPSVVDSKGNVDGLPNVLLEGMASGRAVVASRVAGIPDVIEHGVHGLLVPPGDRRALREALRALADDHGARERLGRAARERAERDLTWPHLSAAMERAYASARALAESRRVR